MTRSGYLLLGLTAIVGALCGVIAFAISRFAAAVRDLHRDSKSGGGEAAFMTAALEEAMTRLRQQERAMSLRAEASERVSGQIMANLTSGLLVVAGDGVVEMLNPAGQRLLGMAEEKGNGHYRAVLTGAAPLADVIEECLTTGQAIVRRAIHLGGSASHVGVTVSPMREGQGPVQGAVCIFSDLSAVIELEEQLRLKDSLARLGELTAGLAHEFRNGLATIHGYARLIDLEKLPSDFRPYVTGLRAETDALREVVTNFLNFAKPTQLALAPVDMRIIAERAAEEIRSDVQKHGGSIEVQGHFSEVLGDEVLLRQAFSNLCRNALEACAEAGRSPHVTIESAVDLHAGHLRVSVSDNGPGLDPSLGERVFQPFVTGRARGTGLGLALVQKIVVTHNGRITAGRSDSGGAAFHVVLPLAVSPVP
ncbi:MAG: two-component system sensor histidine kinase NtrB [Acidobacteriota bacterium]